MKVLVALSLLSVFLRVTQASGDIRDKIPPEILELLASLNQICQEETGIDKSLLKKIHQGVFEDDPKLKCYFKCMMSQLQAMDDSGNLDTEQIEAMMPEPLIEHGALETLAKCKHITHAELCQKAFDLVKCFHKESPEMSIMFE